MRLPTGAIGPLLDVILQRGVYYTHGHVESAGACSVAALVTGGGKLWIIATSDAASRRLIACSDSYLWFRRLLQGGYKKEDTSLVYTFQQVNDIVLIPPMRAHVVITFPKCQNPFGVTVRLGATYHLERELRGDNGRSFVRR